MNRRDVFICHASSDKATHARPLAKELSRRAVSCWVDEGNLKPGESLMSGINQGLAGTNCVLLLITERFLGRPWTEREMAAALSLDLAGNARVIPVLDIGRDELLSRYPLFADTVSLNWSDGVEAVATEVAALFDRQAASDWVFRHEKTHVGPIWTRVVPDLHNAEIAHKVVIRWGSWIWRRTFEHPGGPLSLTHFKERIDQLPMFVEVQPEAIVTIGQGTAPDDVSHDINEGWTRPTGWAPTDAERLKARGDIDDSALRVQWHQRLRAEYLATHAHASRGIRTGDDPLPSAWLERRAGELGISELLGFA